jgi:hypothetical protein
MLVINIRQKSEIIVVFGKPSPDIISRSGQSCMEISKASTRMKKNAPKSILINMVFLKIFPDWKYNLNRLLLVGSI